MSQTNGRGERTPLKTLGVRALVGITVASVISARNLPFMSEYGWSMLALFAFSIVVFLIPISMAIAELGTAWPHDGGVYAWVREGFGGRTGFFAVWCEYSENMPWFPTVLSFTAVSFAYVFDADLANNKFFLLTVMLTAFWGATFINLRGVQLSAFVGSLGTIAGSILPAALVVILGIAYLAQGSASQIPFSADALMPDIHVNNLAFLAGIIVLFGGMEMAGFHAREMRNPGRDVPRAMFLSVIAVVAFSVLGSLFLAIVLPQKEIGLVSGTMQLFQSVLNELDVGWLLRPLALVVAIGGITHLVPWILGPPKGVAAPAREGYMPPRAGRANDRDVPVLLVIIQSIGGTIFSLLFLVVPSVSTSYWMLSAVTAQIVIAMYGLIFASVLRLRYTQPDTPRPYRIPGGKVGIWIVAGVGILGCAFAFYLGFLPPSQLKTGNHTVYVLLLVAAVAALSAPPFVFAAITRRRRVRPAIKPAPAPAG